jgi:hypothetical protein
MDMDALTGMAPRLLSEPGFVGFKDSQDDSLMSRQGQYVGRNRLSSPVHHPGGMECAAENPHSVSYGTGERDETYIFYQHVVPDGTSANHPAHP